MTNTSNDEMKPKLYDVTPTNSNQSLYKFNYLNELLNQQQQLNKRFSTDLQDIHGSVMDSKTEQLKHFQNLSTKLETQEHVVSPLVDKIKQQDEDYQHITDRLEKIETLNTDLSKNIEQDGLVNQAIIDQLSFQDQATQSISRKLDDFEGMNQDILNQLKLQQKSNEELSEKLQLQDAFHKTIMERLDHQEALVQKITRQLDNLKLIIFERASLLLEKIENNFKVTSSYFYSMLSKPSFVRKLTVNKEEQSKEPANKQ